MNVSTPVVAGDGPFAGMQRLESVVSGGLEEAMSVAAALARVRDEGLYRRTAATFEDWCLQFPGLHGVDVPAMLQLFGFGGVAQADGGGA